MKGYRSPPIVRQTESSRTLFLQQGLDVVDHVADRPDRLELFGFYFLAGQFLQFHHEIDGVDAVEVEILIEQGILGYFLRRHFEHVLQRAGQGGQNFLAGHAPAPAALSLPADAMKAARLETVAKWRRTSSFTVSMVMP